MPEIKDDLKQGNQEGSSGDDQAGNEDGDKDSKQQQDGQKKNDQADAGEETVTIKKSELEKLQSDLSNYRQATLDKKADRKLERQQQNDNGSKDQNVDLKKVEEVSTAAASKVISQRETKAANKRFLQDHPEYVDDKQWQELLTHYHGKRGSLSADDILEDLEDAVLTHKRASGQLESYLDEQSKIRARRTEVANQTDAARDAGSVGGKAKDGGGRGTSLTPEGENMSRQFGHDPKAVAKVAPEDRTINVIKKK